MSLLLITTGGIIDSHRDHKQQMIAPLRHTLVPETMNKLGLSYDEHIALCAKDSRDIDINDLNRLLSTIQTTHHDHILITHGYQTMANTMQRFAIQNIKIKKMLFVDSLIPLSEPDSDGEEQLISAHHILTTGNSQLITISALRKKQPITADELHMLQYEGKVTSQWCL